jgi:hypothetical protein
LARGGEVVAASLRSRRGFAGCQVSADAVVDPSPREAADEENDARREARHRQCRRQLSIRSWTSRRRTPVWISSADWHRRVSRDGAVPGGFRRLLDRLVNGQAAWSCPTCRPAEDLLEAAPHGEERVVDGESPRPRARPIFVSVRCRETSPLQRSSFSGVGLVGLLGGTIFG